MKWRLWVLRVLAIILLTATPVATVIAGTVADVSLFATPLFGSGIFSFTVTYVTDTRLDLSWTVGDNVSKVMVRSSYGKYPNDITSANETPSDGSLVYYGNALSYSDTSMDFENNFGMRLYYRAWAQLNDGSWVVASKTGWKESAVLTLIAIFGLALGLTWIGRNYKIMRAIAAAGWVGVAFYWASNPPSSVIVGSSVHSILFVIFLLTALAVFMWPFTTSNGATGESGAGIRFNMDRILGRTEAEPERSSTRQSRVAAYQERLRRADNGER